MKKEFVSASPAQTEEIGRIMSQIAKPGDFFALSGELGAGKTVFTRGFVSALVPEALVSSPSYSILNVYRGNGVTVNHFDMYRITSEDDLESTGFFDVIQNGITLCEWPEKIAFALPDSYWSVRID